MEILFTICGRAGSKGFKNKNLKYLARKPLVHYALAIIDIYQSKHPEYNCSICLNTDSDELIELTTKLNSSVKIIERKPELATDTVGKIEVIRDSFLNLESEKKHFDLIVDLDLTSPLREVSDLEQLISEHLNNIDEKDVYFSVVSARRNPYFNMVKKIDNEVTIVNTSDYTSRQQAPEVFEMNASMYSFKPEFLKKNNYIFNGKCGIIVMKDYLVLDIDSEEDFNWLEFLFPKFLEDSIELQDIYNH
ncbi:MULTISPECIES: acylneuraminate cytidylyltransferase family protein [unclassified Enterococcus]|uniref:acylneuraminate cytidylyltransferase family protein n=1 Tax=unclassified Enterococcus TaxID=2608891 RepID=UPI0013EAD815|nr:MULTISPECIES: acylneuraminate cytidylyltransferase family protein [unclassified Enterococcus]